MGAAFAASVLDFSQLRQILLNSEGEIGIFETAES
jgi:hypothetical protein